jgi:hypothetical protein
MLVNPFPFVSISLPDKKLRIIIIVSLITCLDNWFLLSYIFRRRIVGYAGGLYERESPREAGEAVSGCLPGREAEWEALHLELTKDKAQSQHHLSGDNGLEPKRNRPLPL